ncbi:hypothetical protein EJ08DRAFT_233133 [Tothia fuscella]|uniref:Uncharacterized protein n=1 Tax=Tothia fuscella TaxID=1048955 RepID=A0A9P4U2Z3_9PEZI|nr:hypothetical protein EJ08DRAFT_233133 [Tothia fuscella]
MMARCTRSMVRIVLHIVLLWMIVMLWRGRNFARHSANQKALTLVGDFAFTIHKTTNRKHISASLRKRTIPTIFAHRYRVIDADTAVYASNSLPFRADFVTSWPDLQPTGLSKPSASCQHITILDAKSLESCTFRP